MEGGFALKAALSRAAFWRSLEGVVHRERARLIRHPDLASIGDWSGIDGPRRLVFGARFARYVTLVVAPDEFALKTLEALGVGLTRGAMRPVALVCDSDEGREVVRSWNGGRTMGARTDQLSWHDGSLERFELELPAYAPISGAQQHSTFERMRKKRTPDMVEAQVEITDARVREAFGPVSCTATNWCFTVTVGTLPPLDIECRIPSTDEFEDAALDAIGRKLSGFHFPFEASDASHGFTTAELAVLQRGVTAGVELQAMARLGPPGFGRPLRFWARLVVDGGQPTEIRVNSPILETGDKLQLALVALNRHVAQLRQERRQEKEEHADRSIDELVEQGDIEAAARLYRARHSAFFATLSREQARAVSHAKVVELAGLRSPASK